VVNLGNGTVESNNSKSMVGSIQDEVLTHDGQTNQTKITSRFVNRMHADMYAGETGAIVS